MAGKIQRMPVNHTAAIRLTTVANTLVFMCFQSLATPAVAQGSPPARVVSMNLCTDQLAMLLAAPGQLISVSDLARDPLSSAMADQAAAYQVNYGQAEQIFLMKPDLVLAGTYSSLATVTLLRDLGIRVVQVAPVTSLDEASEQILVIGQALGQEEAAQALAAEFRQGIADLTWEGPAATAAMYYPNGYTSGSGTLSDDVLIRTGFHNIGASAGLTGGGNLPLERLVMAQPQVVVTSTPYPGASRSEDLLTHPALEAIRAKAGVAATTDADWVCGTPHILRAMQAMRTAREALE